MTAALHAVAHFVLHAALLLAISPGKLVSASSTWKPLARCEVTASSCCCCFC